jgi:hypothetical protein
MTTNDHSRPSFTGGILAWWIVVAAVNECLLHLTNLWVEYLARDWDDRTGVGTLFVLVTMNVLLIPVVATTQWLVLRRGWWEICWGAWLAVSAVTALALGLVWLGLAYPTLSSLFKLLIVAIGCSAAAAVAAIILSRSISIFVPLFTCFLVGGVTTVALQFVDLTVLKASLFRPVFDLLRSLSDRQSIFFIWHAGWLLPNAQSAVSLLVSLGEAASSAAGAAISGFGLWMTSQPDRRVLHNVA